MCSAARARRRGVVCPRCAAAGPIAWRRAFATICYAAGFRPVSSCASCEKRQESRQKTDRLPHAAAGVRQLVDDGAIAPDQLGAAELLDAATPFVDVFVAERL